MGIETGTAMLIAAGVSAGVGVMSAMNAPDAPSIPAPPPPASSYYTDSSGVTTEQVWDPSRNAYVTKVDPEPQRQINVPTPPENYGVGPKPIQGNGLNMGSLGTSGQIKYDADGNPTNLYTDQASYQKALSDWQAKYDQAKKDWEAKNPGGENPDWTAWKQRQDQKAADNSIREKIKNQMLSNLSETPADRVAAYQQYADTMSAQMHRDVDQQYADTVRSTNESMAARGMTGSRASVDTAATLAKQKGYTDTDIAQKTGLAKESLKNQDIQNWQNILGNVEAGQKGDVLESMQAVQTAGQAAQQGTASQMAAYYANTNATMQNWQTRVNQNSAMTNAAANAAGGLGMAALYSGRSPITPGGSNNVANGFSNVQNNYQPQGIGYNMAPISYTPTQLYLGYTGGR